MFQTEAYLNLRRSGDSAETSDPKPLKESISRAPQHLPTTFDQPDVDWSSVKTKLEDEARPRYSLTLEAFPVPPVQLSEASLGAVILVSGRFEKISETDEVEVPEWLLDWRLFFLQESTNTYVEVDGSQYELSLFPDIPDPMKEFKYFLVLHPGVASILPPEAMINFFLDMTVRSSTNQDCIQARTSFPVQMEWLLSCWNPNQMAVFPQSTTPVFQETSEFKFEENNSPPPPMSPDYAQSTPEDLSGKRVTKTRKRRRTPQEGRPRAPPSKKKRDLSEEIQKEMDKLFEEAKKLKQRKAVYAQLPAEPPPEILTENNEVRFRCPLCKKVYGRKDSCRKHIASELWEYPCSYCGIISATAQACMYHIMAKHLHMQVFDCPHCDKRFATHYALSNHQERSHPQNPSVLPSTTEIH